MGEKITLSKRKINISFDEANGIVTVNDHKFEAAVLEKLVMYGDAVLKIHNDGDTVIAEDLTEEFLQHNKTVEELKEEVKTKQAIIDELTKDKDE